MNTLMRRLADGLERVVGRHLAELARQQAELRRVECRMASVREEEAHLRNRLQQLFAGPFHLDRASLFDLRRRGSGMRQACVEYRADIALLEAQAVRIRDEIHTRRGAVGTLCRRRERLLHCAEKHRRAGELRRELSVQREVEERAWRTGLQ